MVQKEIYRASATTTNKDPVPLPDRFSLFCPFCISRAFQRHWQGMQSVAWSESPLGEGYCLLAGFLACGISNR
jgi:hypothetical protein